MCYFRFIFWLFTNVLQEIRRELTQKVRISFERPRIAQISRIPQTESQPQIRLRTTPRRDRSTRMLTSLFALRGQNFKKRAALRAALHKELIKSGEWPIGVATFPLTRPASWLLQRVFQNADRHAGGPRTASASSCHR
jgi:hypothetical protein